MPKACHSCGWKKVCEAVNLGSASIHRYKNGKVNQKSVFCQPLQALFTNAAEYMHKQGLTMDKIQAVLHTPTGE